MKTITKIFILTIFLLIYYKFSYSQGYGNLQIKEKYDSFYDIQYSPFNAIQPPDVPSTVDLYLQCDSKSYCLLSLIRMYETTNDKAYLIKFINWSIKFQALRGDVGHPTIAPYWRDFSSACKSPMGDGDILMAMSAFVYFVKHNQDIYFTSLPMELINIPSVSGFEGLWFFSYGDFAEWLSVRVRQSLNWYLFNSSFWLDEKGLIANPGDYRALSINQQSGFATALIYMGLSPTDDYTLQTYPYQDYRDKAGILGHLYKSKVFLKRNVNDCPNYDESGECFSVPVMQ